MVRRRRHSTWVAGVAGVAWVASLGVHPAWTQRSPAAAPPAGAPSRGGDVPSSSPGDGQELPTSCLDELTARGVPYRPVQRRDIALAVEITGPVGGVELRYRQPLVIDCSLAVSMDEAGRYLRALGVATVHIASAHSRRNVRGTTRLSKHSFGLALDVPSFEGQELGQVRVDQDYEQGLGDAVDCVGAPVTPGGAVLRVALCQLVRSGLFHLVLSPDYDDAHHDHLHLEVLPWSARARLRSDTPAIH